MNQFNPGAFVDEAEAAELEVSARLREYLRQHGNDLVGCCGWLGGRFRALRAANLLASLARPRRPGPQQLRMLQDLHRLLALEFVDEIDSAEAARFSQLNLNDARVERCCRHCEALEGALADLAFAEEAYDAVA